MAASMTFDEWSARWRIPPQALEELAALSLVISPAGKPGSEAAIQTAGRLTAARRGALLWRNNRGAFEDSRGAWVRYGLANDSKKLGDSIKSADCVGIEPVKITAEHVGSTIGRFLSVEFKSAAWHPDKSPEYKAQLAWATLINAHGGRATITNDPTRA